MGNAIRSMGDYPPEYNRAIHGHYDPSVYYGKRDTPLGEVKLSELSAWLGRRNKTPYGIVRAFSRAYWRHTKVWLDPKKPGIIGYYHRFFFIGLALFILDYPAYSRQKRYRYH